MKSTSLVRSVAPNIGSFRNLKAQKGITLIVALIMVLLMTIVALSSIRGSGLQEAMAGNLRDRNIALQACETSLREGESRIDSRVKVLPNFDGTGGMFTDLNTNPATSVLYMTNAQWKASGVPIAGSLKGATDKPLYVVEEISVDRGLCGAMHGNGIGVGASPGSCPTPYRTSCFGSGMTADATVIAQSMYSRPD